jgi:hypothetical protein
MISASRRINPPAVLEDLYLAHCPHAATERSAGTPSLGLEDL